MTAIQDSLDQLEYSYQGVRLVNLIQSVAEAAARWQDAMFVVPEDKEEWKRTLALAESRLLDAVTALRRIQEL